MKKNNTETNVDFFDEILIKEKEQRYMEKKHGKLYIMNMAQNTEKLIQAEKKNIFLKIKNMYLDHLDSKELKKQRKKALAIYNSLPEEDKLNKLIDSIEYKRKDVAIIIELERISREKHILADCGGISFPIVEFNVFLYLQYSGISSEKYFFKTFNTSDDAKTYFNVLKNKYKNYSINKIFDELIFNLDSHMKELNIRIKKYEKKFGKLDEEFE